ncbi:MAG TPA: helix-turn-helix domain-containing protein [Longimicrobiaceae bacterium]|nr:helix-turn-helix domain-containing protein [Longimicrobiaceae bacterium]
MQGIRYAEHAPPPDLADRVECIWTVRSAAPVAGVHLSRVLPDGCTDVVFNLGDPPLREGMPHHRLRSYVVGAMRRPLEVRMRGAVELVGVRFRPGGSAAFLPLPLAEITDAAVALSEVWGSLADELESRLPGASHAERVRIVEAALRERRGRGRPLHAAVARACALIARSGGCVAVEALAAETGTSRRHLERLFLEQVGLTPKTAARVARFRRLCGLLPQRPGAGWSRLALECGYHDQAHMTREFRALSGLTPGAYHRERVASVQDGGAAGE